MSSVSSTTLALSTTSSSALGTTHLNTTVGGLDIDALVSATIAANSIPITTMQNKNALLQAQINDYSTIKTALNTLQYAVNDLTYSSAFSGRIATSSNTNAVTASTTSGGTNGSYAIHVASMATITSNSSAALGNGGSKASLTGGTALANLDTALGDSGTFSINGTSIAVTTTDTVNTIVAKITASGAGVTASVGTDGKITLTQNKVGATPTITLGTDTSGFLASAGLTTATVTAGVDDTSAGTKASVTGTGTLTNLNQAITVDNLITAGNITINNQSIAITATDTINTIANKITASGAGVTATITNGQLTLTQKTAGSSQTISIDDGGTGFFTTAGITSAAAAAAVGKNSDESSPLSSVTGLSGITGGYFSINGTFFSVDPATDTIDSIIQKINASTTAGVSAFYDSTTHKISLTSQTAGNENITLGTSGTGGTDDSNFLSQVGLVQGNQQTGADAVVTVNGVTVTPTNNQITYQGNTFTLVGAGDSTVTVNNDINATVTKVQTFITAYNAAMDAITAKTTQTPDSSSTDASVGDLFGDSTLNSIEQSLRDYTSAIVTSQSSTMQQLSQIGITTGTAGVYDIDKVQSGHLELDTTKLTAALTSNSSAVASLLGNTTVNVTDEKESSTDGGKTYTLKYGANISGDPTLKVDNGFTYTLVNLADLKPYGDGTGGTTTQHQYAYNSSTGTFTFADPLASTVNVTASYNYDVSSGSNAGLLVQMNTMLNSYTQYGGILDASIGSNGSLTQMISYNNDRISDMKLLLASQQATLYTKYQNMQTVLSSVQSQGSYITALLNSLNGSSSSK
jgi:flagellar hook-associated protein 2